MNLVREKRAPHFCKPMKRHFMTQASANAAVALSMAKELHSMAGPCTGVSELVQVINQASLELIRLCQSAAGEIAESNEEPDRGRQAQ